MIRSILTVSFVLGLLALTGASVVRRDTGDKLGENLGLYPELTEPTNEEWIAIIKSTVEGGDLPIYLQETQFTISSNDTGSFNTTSGTKGNWSTMAYVNVTLNGNVNSTLAFSVQSLAIGSLHVDIAEISGVVYRDVGHNAILRAGAKRGAAFLKKNSTHELFGRFEQFNQGSIAPWTYNDSYIFSNFGMSITNSSHYFTLKRSGIAGELYQKGDHFTYKAATSSISVPINDKKIEEEGWPSKADELMELLEEASSREAWQTTGDTSGEYTLGKTGTFKSNHFTEAFSQAGQYFNITASRQGNYSDVKGAGEHLSFLDTMEFSTYDFL